MTRKPQKAKEAHRRAVRVHIARPKDRCLQLFYDDPETGKRVRITTGTFDEEQAEYERQQLEARLRLGLKRIEPKTDLPEAMSWADFRHLYSEQKTMFMRVHSAADAESRLDIAERILEPNLLADVATTETLELLQRELLKGAHSRHNRPRSTATVRGHMKSVLAALSFAKKKKWIPEVPAIDHISIEESDIMKGRPLCSEEVDRLLAATVAVVGEQAETSWQYVIRGVIASGLRMGELMNVSWDIPQTIQPSWKKGRLPTLWFPAHLQKNKRAQEIPLCPWLEVLLLETPVEQRTGWAFKPASLQSKMNRKSPERISAERVGKIISKIGKKAGIIVDEGNPRTGSPPKFASLHDLRRTFAQQLADSNLDPQLVRKLMRHADIRTTERYYQVANVQRDADRIRAALAGVAITTASVG